MKDRRHGAKFTLATWVEIGIILVGVGIFAGRVEVKLGTIDVSIIGLEKKIDKVWNDFYQPVVGRDRPIHEEG